MSAAVELNDANEKPLDPAMEKVRRKMVRLLVVSVGIMMAGLMAVLYTLVHKISETPKKAVAQEMVSSAFTSLPGKEITGTITLPVGAQINNQSLSGARLLMDITLTDGQRQTVIYDLVEQRIIARLTVTNTQ
jgi:hypothetical protein